MVARTSTAIRRRRSGSHHIHIDMPHVPHREVQSSIPWHATFVFLIPGVSFVVQSHYYGSSPLSAHPANMWTFILCLLIYCLALIYYVNSQVSAPAATIYKKLSAKVAVISGSLASAALISVLVPHSLEPIVFIICLMFLFIYFGRNPILHVGQKAFSYVKRKWKQITGSRDDPATILRV